MATMLSQKLVEAQEANDTVRDFMRRFEIGKLLSSCRAQKTKGFSVVELFVYMVCCIHENRQLSGSLFQEYALPLLRQRRDQLALVCPTLIREDHQRLYSSGNLRAAD